MVDPTHHHRRIHRRARAIHWGLLPLALVVPGVWIYLALDVCQETSSPLGLGLCRLSLGVPLLPGLLGLVIAGLILKDLAHLGAHHQGAPQPRLRHVKHGYDALEQAHKRRVHWALLLAAAVAVGLCAWLGYEIVSTTY